MLTPKDLSKPQIQAYRDILTKKRMCISSDCGFGKCLHPDTKVMMYDGSIRKAKDISIGDKLLGDDNTVRTVIERNDGQSPMFKIIPTKGEPWGCNVNHTLCTVSSSRSSLGPAHGYYEIDVCDYLKLSNTSQKALKQYSVGFNGWKSHKRYEYDPYFVGVWLGDGTTKSIGVTNGDREVQVWLSEYAKEINMGFREDWGKPNSPQFYITNGVGQKNPLWAFINKNFRDSNGYKCLPEKFFTVCRKQRLRLLAGLLDTDGYYDGSGFEFTQKHLHLTDSICTLIRSLGFFVTRTTKVVNGVNYYRLYITGCVEEIPTIVPRKQATPRRINKAHDRVGFKVKPDGFGDYVGLVVDGNHRFLLHDFTVCHNTISCLNAFTMLLKKQPGSKMLVVCNKEGVEKTWPAEHKKWSHTKHLKIITLVGTPAKRAKLLEEKADGYVISYHLLDWLRKNNPDIKFNFVFADEGDCLKGRESKWRQYLIECAPTAKYRIISSATPKTREEDDYWGLCHYLDGGKSLRAPTAEIFNAMYCDSFVDRSSYHTRYKMKKEMIPVLENRIQHLFFRYELSEQATIPIKTITYTVKLRPSSRKKYDALQKSQCLNSIVFKESEDGKVYKDEKNSLNATTLSAKLAQLSNGFVYMDEAIRIKPSLLAKATNDHDLNKLIKSSKKVVAVDIFNDRERAMKRLVKKIHKRHGVVPIAIPYFHKHELIQLQRTFPTGVPDTSPNFQERWNRKEIPYLFMQYSRSSKSLNLQQGGFIMVFYSPTFKWVDDYQIVRRLARQGQKESTVYVYRLYIKGTIDDVKTKRLDERFQGHWRFQKKLLQKINR